MVGEFGMDVNLYRQQMAERNRARSLFGHNPRVPQKCGVCGKKYLITLSQQARGRYRYCSLSCASRSRGKLDPVQLFWTHVEKSDKCWLWTGGTVAAYGYFSTVKQLAHRYSWFLCFGTIPDGLNVCHKCDVPLCVNPAHLFLGSAKDNSDDKVRKNRQAKHKLRTEQVHEIRRRYAGGGVFQYVLAAEYGVSQQLISEIIREKQWKYVCVNNYSQGDKDA